MVASLLRVLHGGIQDSRLLPPRGKPNIDMFRVVIPRAGRFTTQWVRLDFDTRPQFGSKATLTVPVKGQLLNRLFLVATMPDITSAQEAAKAQVGPTLFLGPNFTWTNSLGHALIQGASVEIGGSTVESLDGRLMEVLDEFYTPLERVELVNRLIRRNMTNFPQYPPPTNTQVVTPLPFWFCRGDAGVFLPIDALAADSVRISITFNSVDTLYVSTARLDLSGNKCLSKGAAFYALQGATFYAQDPSGNPVPGLNGNPNQTTNASGIGGIQLPNRLALQDTYLLAEYTYLDAPEANRFRISDIEVPIIQHYAFEPVETQRAPRVSIPLRIANPVRNLFFFAQRVEAPQFNALFLATRDLSGDGVTTVPWWPNAAPINARAPGNLQPGFVFRDSEPLASAELMYEGKLMRYSSTSPVLFRSILPALEMKKAPYVNRYYYMMHFGLNHGALPPSQPNGEGNLDKITRIALNLEFKPFRGSVTLTQVPNYNVYVWAETYNVFRVYGGRGGLLFAYP